MWIRALFRAVMIAVAIGVGQIIVTHSSKTGIWAMVSLGIGSALLGAVLVRIIANRGRFMEGIVQFLATALVMEIFFWTLPTTPVTGVADFLLALAVGLVSAMAEWVVPDHPVHVR